MEFTGTGAATQNKTRLIIPDEERPQALYIPFSLCFLIKPFSSRGRDPESGMPIWVNRLLSMLATDMSILLKSHYTDTYTHTVRSFFASY